MHTRDSEQPFARPGLYTLEAEFYTESLVVRGEVPAPEQRLSDHLNGGAPNLELRPLSVRRAGAADPIGLHSEVGQIAKEHLLFAVPVRETNRIANDQNGPWRWTVTQRCYGLVGPYTLIGKLHAEAGRDPRLILRLLSEREFHPITEAVVTFPGGVTKQYDTVIVNRRHLEFMALL
jgi:hypothetical protein